MWSVKIRPNTRSASLGRGFGVVVSWMEIVVAAMAPPSGRWQDNAPARGLPCRPRAGDGSSAAGASAAEARSDRDRLLAAQAPDQRQVGRDLASLFREQPVQVVDAGDVLAGEADD